MPSELVTEKLALNQWQPEEYPKRVDFNSDNKKIDDFAIEADERLSDLETNQNNIRHYNAFSEVNETFDATTPIITLFQAMQPNSILNCVVNQANSVYPSAQGSLNLTKMTETEGSVQFLSSDGKLSTGAFTQAV